MDSEIESSSSGTADLLDPTRCIFWMVKLWFGEDDKEEHVTVHYRTPLTPSRLEWFDHLKFNIDLDYLCNKRNAKFIINWEQRPSIVFVKSFGNTASFVAISQIRSDDEVEQPHELYAEVIIPVTACSLK